MRPYRGFWDGQTEHPARRKRRLICLLCQGPTQADGWCPACDVFPPRTIAERADMLTRHRRFRGMLIPHGPRSGLILSTAADALADVDFQNWRGTPAIVEPNFGCDKNAGLRLPGDGDRHGDPFGRAKRKDKAA